jgi:hypothetical protein
MSRLGLLQGGSVSRRRTFLSRRARASKGRLCCTNSTIVNCLEQSSRVRLSFVHHTFIA